MVLSYYNTIKRNKIERKAIPLIESHYLVEKRNTEKQVADYNAWAKKLNTAMTNKSNNDVNARILLLNVKM
jgi:hypothetical protein